jgi:nicotinate-nucleotide adenylyltransferase
MKIGILGGTFDPVHVGHIAAANAASECAGLDRVVFIPAALPPHRGAAVAPASDRLQMCRLATAGDARFAVSDVEVTRAGPSYTLDTLVDVSRAHPHDELLLILGWDAASQFRTWHKPEQVQAIAPIVVIARPGREWPQDADLLAAGLDPARVVFCPRPTPDVSASEVRRACGAGESISDMVPAAVERYILLHGLYRAIIV